MFDNHAISQRLTAMFLVGAVVLLIALTMGGILSVVMDLVGDARSGGIGG